MFGGKKYGSLFRQLIVGLAASLSVLSCATVFAWVTPTLPKLLSEESVIPMTPEEASWMVIMPEFGNLVSAVPSGLLADRFGRKALILTSAPLFLTGWTLVLYFKTLLALNVARVIQGVAVGVVYVAVPMYLGEISSPKYRGAVTSVFYILWWFGFLLEYVLGSNMTFLSFKYATALTNMVAFVVFLWQPESPYYLLMKNDSGKARKSLVWLLNNDDVDEVLESMKKCIDEDSKKSNKWNEVIATPADRKALMILFLSGFLRQLNGSISLSVYATHTLLDEGDNFFISPDGVTNAMGVLFLVGSVVGFFTLDLFGRRSMFLISCLVSGTSMFCAGTFYFFKSHCDINVSSFAWVPPTSFLILSFASVSGIFLVSITFSSELFTSNTRAMANGVHSVYTTFIGVFVLKMYLTIYYNVGSFANFYIFSACSFLGAVLIYFIVPETKGKTFEQIRQEL